MPGYPKESSKYTADCKKSYKVDLAGGIVEKSGFSNRKNTQINHRITFTVPASIYHYDATANFTVDASSTDHDVYQEINLGVGLATWHANSATNDEGSNWQRIVNMGTEKSEYNQQVEYKPTGSLKLNAGSNYFIIALTIVTFENGGWGGCESFIWKYEKSKSVASVLNPVNNNVTDSCNVIGLKEKNTCAKTFVIEGPGRDGKSMKVHIKGHKIFRDFCGQEKDKQIIRDLETYQGHPYTRIGDPSYRWDCAGWTADKIWKTGPVNFVGDNFYREVIKNFATEITGRFLNHDVREGDIVAYHASGTGEVGHITIVRRVERVSGFVTRVQIETKNSSESVFLHDLPLFSSNIISRVGIGDPLILKFGIPHVYRIPANVTMKELKPGDCD